LGLGIREGEGRSDQGAGSRDQGVGSRESGIRFGARLFEGSEIEARVVRARARAHEEATVALTTVATNCA